MTQQLNIEVLKQFLEVTPNLEEVLKEEAQRILNTTEEPKKVCNLMPECINESLCTGGGGIVGGGLSEKAFNQTKEPDHFGKESIEKEEEYREQHGFSKQQIDAMMEILDGLVKDGKISRCRYAMLVAEMQSGKTDTFLLVAAEMLRLGKVVSVTIFSGNRETDLREQLKQNLEEFKEKYGRYLEAIGVSRTEERRMMSLLTTQIKIVWGPDLKKERSQPRTLYIWEESHHAQTQKQEVHKFLSTIGISADGNVEMLEQNDNYFLSVSATPFSELSDFHKLMQNKIKVRLATGQKYKGVGFYKERGNIKLYKDCKKGLSTALIEASKKRTPSYALVRMPNKVSDQEKIRQLVEDHGWAQEVYDQSSERSSLDEIISDAPIVNKVIFFKGLCRMGQQVKKTHISFVLETCGSGNTDTILQSLLGRMCGYHDIEDILIYLHESIVNGGELERYIEMSKGELAIPLKGMNMKKGHKSIQNKSNLYPCIPIRFLKTEVEAGGHENLNLANLLESTDAENNNGQEQTDEIISMLNDTENFKVMRRNGNEKSHKAGWIKLKKSFADNMPDKLGSSAGCKADGSEMYLWSHPDEPRYAYLYCFTETKPVCLSEIGKNEDEKLAMKIRMLPETTRKEVFCCTTETGREVVGNGGFNMQMSEDTCNNSRRMLESLKECIELSLKENATMICPRCITSNKKVVAGWTGIMVTPKILKSLSKGGEIFNTLKEQYGVSLKLTKTRGPASKNPAFTGFERLSEIAW
jgi:hypothetical protein